MPPIIPPILIAQPFDLRVKSFVSPVSELTFPLISINPVLAEVSSVVFAVRNTSSLSISMSLSAAL